MSGYSDIDKSPLRMGKCISKHVHAKRQDIIDEKFAKAFHFLWARVRPVSKGAFCFPGVLSPTHWGYKGFPFHPQKGNGMQIPLDNINMLEKAPNNGYLVNRCPRLPAAHDHRPALRTGLQMLAIEVSVCVTTGSWEAVRSEEKFNWRLTAQNTAFTGEKRVDLKRISLLGVNFDVFRF